MTLSMRRYRYTTSNRGSGGYSGIYIVFMFLLVFGSCFRGVLVSDQVAYDALSVQGYTEVRITERHWFAPWFFGCDRKDAVGFEVSAVNPRNQRVTLTVCSGFLFKGATIRSK